MSRSIKSKFAVTLLGALAFSANSQARGLDKNQVAKTGFSIKNTKPSHLTEKKSDTNAVVGTSSFSTLGRVVLGIVGIGVMYNETSGAVSGKTWCTGKYSIVNGVRSMLNGNKDNQKPKYDKPPGDNDKGSGLKKGQYYDENLASIQKVGETEIAQLGENVKLEKEGLAGLIELCRKFVELTEKDNSWIGLVSYLYDADEKKGYSRNPESDGTEQLNEVGLKKYKDHVDRLISCLRGNDRLVAINYDHIWESVSFKLDDVKYSLSRKRASNAEMLAFECCDKNNEFEIQFSVS